VAGFRPGFGRGGMTHSFVVTSEGAATPDAGAMAAIFDAFAALMAMVGRAGAILAGEPVLEGVDTAGDAMSLIDGYETANNEVNVAHWKLGDEAPSKAYETRTIVVPG
jgi:hypothetical protein